MRFASLTASASKSKTSLIILKRDQKYGTKRYRERTTQEVEEERVEELVSW
jgi:hypothetical protein